MIQSNFKIYSNNLIRFRNYFQISSISHFFNSYMKKHFLTLSIFILLILTFLGGLRYTASRSMLESWNMGHIILFCLIVVFFDHSWKWYQEKKSEIRIFVVVLFTGVLSIIIELSQYIFANGTPDILDVRRNFAGAMLGFAFTMTLRNKLYHNFLKGFAVIWVCFEFIPVARALADEIHANLEFPVLADFETNLELTRWSGEDRFLRSNEHVKHGTFALKVNFGTEKYSGFALNHFPDDWSGYTCLKYEVYYPEYDTLQFTCRIHDAEHTKGVQEYSDRFNRRYQLIHGWNTITIPLNDISNAPKDRKMDMTKIMSIGIFTVQLPMSKIAWFDYFRLE